MSRNHEVLGGTCLGVWLKVGGDMDGAEMEPCSLGGPCLRFGLSLVVLLLKGHSKLEPTSP